MKYSQKIANPGSALGEAIGALMEKALVEEINDIADKHGCHYVTSGVRKTKAGNQAKKLLMSDNFGNEYDIDGLLANQAMQPLILFESKYIRYKKHNRDKGSWVCTAHSAIKRRYHSIRSSIAILAGNWSQSSLAMMKSHDINLFLIPFDFICDVLKKYGIDFEWEEKERNKATQALHRFKKLNEKQQAEIGEAMIAVISHDLSQLIDNILDNSIEREIKKVFLELVSNLGEVKTFEFESVEEAIEFLGDDELSRFFLIDDSITLFEPPPQL